MDLDISMRSSACLYTVHFYGALFREGDVWICMEVMDTSLDKFYPKVYKNDRVINEDILGKVRSNHCNRIIYTLWTNKYHSWFTWFQLQIAVAVVNALYYLHANLKVIHRYVNHSVFHMSNPIRMITDSVLAKINSFNVQNKKKNTTFFSFHRIHWQRRETIKHSDKSTWRGENVRFRYIWLFSRFSCQDNWCWL